MSSGIISNGTTYEMNPWFGMQGNRWTDDLVKCEQTSLGTATNAFYPGDLHPIEQHEFEDRSFYFCSDDGCSLYGVFDGHDGSKLSNFVAQRIPADLLLGQLSGPKTDEEIKSILQQAFVAVERGYFETVNDPLSEKAALQLQIRENMHYKPSQDIQKKLQEVEAKISGGTTATVALIHNNKLFVINVGNTRALFCKSENGTLHVNQLSVDHTVSNDDELRRLLHLGLDVEKLKIVRKLGKSENTRCIGDYSVKAGYKDIENLRSATSEPVIAEPYLCDSFTIDSSPAFLLIMSHGLYKAVEDIPTITEPANCYIASLVAQEFSHQTSLKCVAQAVVNRVVSYHQDAHNKPEWHLHVHTREDISLLVRSFSYPIGGSSPTGPRVSIQHHFYPHHATNSVIQRMYSQLSSGSSISDSTSPLPVQLVSPSPTQLSHIMPLISSVGPTSSTPSIIAIHHVPHMSPINTNESDSSRSSTQTTMNSPSSTQQTINSQTSTATGTNTNSTQSSGDSIHIPTHSTPRLHLDNDGKVESYVDFTEFNQKLLAMSDKEKQELYLSS
ncbi:TGF-beta-activated kinase 1 and MAP3K7-binding protein 1 [Octopus bimaculoides]|uniref:PPM-type phosphatase domain-containing protein n=1 Tax=Octopus bimaculoides TaxID=37653 RepID=A0A0L8GZH8_OCTBM|nr:TGF-beta-activated kinase 1 and MAP3K7-binding protein 1 [Octopus bimaculoides]|eukprot:XP_014776667.1 PREDICTED: TGF-beta-activated kinase 1 and MAP3K7-binding protein 1-like [Octopus bimaculoides]